MSYSNIAVMQTIRFNRNAKCSYLIIKTFFRDELTDIISCPVNFIVHGI